MYNYIAYNCVLVRGVCTNQRLCVVHVHVHICMTGYLHIPEPWLQFIHSSLVIREPEQGKVEGATRVEALVSGLVHTLEERGEEEEEGEREREREI